MDHSFLKRFHYTLIFFIGLLSISLFTVTSSYAKKKCIVDECDVYEISLDQDSPDSNNDTHPPLHPFINTRTADVPNIIYNAAYYTQNKVTYNSSGYRKVATVHLYILFHQLRSHIG